MVGFVLAVPLTAVGLPGESKTIIPLLVGDGSRHWWWPQLVLKVGGHIHLVKSSPTPCVVGGVLAPRIAAIATAGSSQYAVEHVVFRQNV